MFCVVTSQAAVFVTETQEAGWLSAETKLAITLRFPAGGATWTSGKCGGSEPLHSMTRFM